MHESVTYDSKYFIIQLFILSNLEMYLWLLRNIGKIQFDVFKISVTKAHLILKWHSKTKFSYQCPFSLTTV